MTTNDFTERLLAEGPTRRVEFLASVEPMIAVARAVCVFLSGPWSG
jgi:hypothetical protein